MKKMIILFAVSTVALLSLAACAGTGGVAGTNQPNYRTLSASGSGQVYLVPDVAYITVGVRVDADEVSDALSKNNSQANEIAQALQALGVEKKDIQTSNFNVYPMMDYGMDGQITRRYYVVENTVFITVRDLTVGATGIDKVYDGTTAATVTLTDNRVTGDVFIASYTSASFADANAGSGISVSVIGISIAGVDAGNYNLLNTTAATTANITPKPITVTANSGQYKIFGTVDPVFTYTYAPNDPPIAFNGLLSREPGEEIGGYAITQGTLSAGSNYAINFVSATFRITGELMYLPFVRK